MSISVVVCVCVCVAAVSVCAVCVCFNNLALANFVNTVFFFLLFCMFSSEFSYKLWHFIFIEIISELKIKLNKNLLRTHNMAASFHKH